MRDETKRAHRGPRTGPVIAAGIVLGLGLGGFADGILFHQILQWHATMSAQVPPADLEAIRYNQYFDGLYQAATWALTLIGVAALFLAGRRVDVRWSGRVLLGAMLVGWGLFNLVEGAIGHQLLALHHVRETADWFVYDMAFLASGVVLIVIGAALARTRTHRHQLPARGRGVMPGDYSDPLVTGAR